jgi:hypothetical protein
MMLRDSLVLLYLLTLSGLALYGSLGLFHTVVILAAP